MLLLNHLELSQFIFFKEIFQKNNQAVYVLFSQYQKYLCKIFSLWTYPL